MYEGVLMVGIGAVLEVVEVLWSERMFIISAANLIVLSWLSLVAHNYRKEKSDPPNFEVKDAKLLNEEKHLQLEFENVGEGECEHIKIANVGYYAGNDTRGLREVHETHEDHFIKPGEVTRTTIVPSPGYYDAKGEERVFAVDYEVDGLSRRLHIFPSELSEESWYME